jgi:WD40 repeat protein
MIMIRGLGDEMTPKLAYFPSCDRILRILDLRTGVLERVGLVDGSPLEFKAMELSPDGRTVATGTQDGSVQVWDIATRRQLHRFAAHTASVHTLAFSPGGRLLASADAVDFGNYQGGGTCLWELSTGKRLWFAPSEGGARDFAFSPDGRYLAVCNGQVLQVSDGKPLFSLAGPLKDVGLVRFSPDGRRIVTADDDGLIQFWNPDDGRLQNTLRGHVRNVAHINFSPDGLTLVSGGRDRTIRLWNVATGQEIAALTGHQSEGCFVAFCLGGKALATFGNKELFLWPSTRYPLPPTDN